MALDLPPVPPAAAAAMPRDGGDGPEPAATGRVRRPGALRRVLRGARWVAASPTDWLGRREIGEGGAAIRSLASAIRAGDRRGPFVTHGDGAFDVEGTAEALGIGAEGLSRRLAARRRQTARVAWGMWALAAVFVVAWARQAFLTELSADRVLSLAWFLPFIAMFVLLGVQNALVNFQIRTRRAAGWREWLATEDRFWPS